MLFLGENLLDHKSEEPTFPSEIVAILEPRIAANLSSMDRITLAMSYFDLGRIPEARAQWEKAISADPKLDNAINQGNLGQQLLKAGVLHDALPHFQRAYDLDPQNATYRADHEKTRQTVAER